MTNPITNDGATLGRVLFYDKHLSANNTISCGSCHHQDKAFTDAMVTSKGFEGKLTRRNSMSTVNLRYFPGGKMFWDLRAKDLEEQSLMPIQDHIEMGMKLEDLSPKLSELSYYPDLFKKAFGTEEITCDRISMALSQFLRSKVSFHSKYDEGVANGFSNFTPEELRGQQLMRRAFCNECHSDLSTVLEGTRNTYFIDPINLKTINGLDETYVDNGVGELTNLSKDMGVFKTPSLRNVAVTAPYMHDGRFKTLKDVLNHYSTGVKANPNKGVQLFGTGFNFTEEEKSDIIAFLNTLTDEQFLTDPKYSDPFK